jgi:hypothetical protein
MKCFIRIMLPMIVLASLPCYAQTGRDNLFSLDLSYLLTSFKNQGWGIGLNYEKRLFGYLSVMGNFGHMTFLTGIEDVYCTSVHFSVFANYYPLGNGLDKLYIGVGNGCDFMNYFGDGELPCTTGDTLIHITPKIGWKFNILEFFMIDIPTGYKFLVASTQNYNAIENYVNVGLCFGISFKILFNSLKKGVIQ